MMVDIMSAYEIEADNVAFDWRIMRTELRVTPVFGGQKQKVKKSENHQRNRKRTG